jgi:hypothetical protein
MSTATLSLSPVLLLTAATILDLADEHRAGRISKETFDRRASMLRDSIHRSDLDEFDAYLASKGVVIP